MVTVSALLTDIKRKAQIEQNQQTITDADILDLANRELQSYVAPKLVVAQERYFSTFIEYNVSSTQRRYRIPARCIGGRVLDVTLFANTFEYRLPRLHPTESTRIEWGFFFDGRDIVISSNIISGILRIYYQLRPSTMVTSTTTASVSSVSASAIGATIANGTYDVIGSAGLNQVAVPNIVINSNVAAQPADWIQTVNLQDYATTGDLVVPQGQTTTVPLPLELHDVLAFRCAMRIKQMKGLIDDYNSMRIIYEEVEANAYALVTPRSENAEKAIRPLDMLGWGY